MVTIGLKKGPSKRELIESFERYGQPNDDGALFVTDDDTSLVGHISGLEYDKQNDNAFSFSGDFSGKFLRGYYHTKAKKGWIETDLTNLSTIKKIKMLLENGEKIRTRNYLLLVYNKPIDIETATFLASNDLVHFPTVKELKKILPEIDDEFFDTMIPRGYISMNKTGLQKQNLVSNWTFLAEDSLNGATKHTMYGISRDPNGNINAYSTIKIDELPTLATAIFVFN